MVFDLHIGVLAFPFGTHAGPLLTLVQRLAASSPRTQFSFLNTRVSNGSMFNARVSVPYENIKVYDVWDGMPQGFWGNHFEAIRLFLSASPDNFEKVIEKAEEETGLKLCCLISDAFLSFACDLAEKRGVPWVAFWGSASHSLSVHVHTEEILKAVGSTEVTKQEHTLSYIPGLTKVRLSDLPPENFLDKNPSLLALTINNMVQKLPKSIAVVLNCFEEIDPVITNDLKSKFKHLLNIGPLMLGLQPQHLILSSPNPRALDDKTGCLSWLDNQNKPRSAIYISFGSFVTPSKNEVMSLAEALETCQIPFLWSMKDHVKKSLPEGFLNRTIAYGKIVAWAPQLQVLGHSSIGAFISHCGWNSILESICSCVPMICVPMTMADHKLNARMVVDSWKIGVGVEGVLTKSKTIEALNHVMFSEVGKSIRENIYRLKEKALDAVKLDGSSTKNYKKLLEIISAPKVGA
ncbi:UDP-glucuronosyl and UDP-glucosyl transferase [Handroanthus impetiginosus]|uniref:UDP-glucuronosyl and UDP-glucosyl transferase n=1 Tax=Handroanthus impetiginosus TaxID=429701 RepID=A0A2G9HSM7_9LAMI|nr:UDP-glucuronosyl and UDP-glucosyl transferase [Handroanthus impetiginosus]